MRSKVLSVIAAVIMATSASLAVSSPAEAKVTKYKTCSAMYKKYPYGIKVKGAKDKVASGFKKVTNPKTVSKSLYNASKKLDKDKDKMVCELPKYKNCAKLNSKYAHGFGLKGAKDKTSASSKPVKNFSVVSYALYKTNSHLDRDKDKISCEKYANKVWAF
jgi:hypothetical protein